MTSIKPLRVRGQGGLEAVPQRVRGGAHARALQELVPESSRVWVSGELVTPVSVLRILEEIPPLPVSGGCTYAIVGVPWGLRRLG